MMNDSTIEVAASDKSWAPVSVGGHIVETVAAFPRYFIASINKYTLINRLIIKCYQTRAVWIFLLNFANVHSVFEI